MRYISIIALLIFFIGCNPIYNEATLKEVYEQYPNHSKIFLSPGFTCTSDLSVKSMLYCTGDQRQYADYVLLVEPGEQVLNWIYDMETHGHRGHKFLNGRGKLYETIKPKTSYYLIYHEKRVGIIELEHSPFPPSD